MQKVIGVDFDGTLCVNQYPAIGKPIEKALVMLEVLFTKGHTLILWTCREGQYLEDAKQWLMEQGVFHYFSHFNENAPDRIATYGECRKLGADLYIDDKGLGFSHALLENLTNL